MTTGMIITLIGVGTVSFFVPVVIGVILNRRAQRNWETAMVLQFKLFKLQHPEAYELMINGFKKLPEPPR